MRRSSALAWAIGSVAAGGCGTAAVADVSDASPAVDASSLRDASLVDATAASDAGMVDGPTMAGDAGAALSVTEAAVYEVAVTYDVVYGQGLRRRSWDAAEATPMDLTLDIYQPVGGPARHPAMVVIHGGGFHSGTSRNDAFVDHARFFAARGWVAFSINYRLDGDYGYIPASWPPPPPGEGDQWYAIYAASRDAKAAVRWVHAHAAEYGVDGDHVAALGGSAGAFLAVMLGVTDPEDYRDEAAVSEDRTLASTNLGARSDVQTVIDYWGGMTLVNVLEAIDGRERFARDDAAIAIVHGRNDTTVPLRYGEALRDRCMATGVPHAFHPFDGGHGAWDVRIDGQTLSELAFDFIVADQGLELR